MCLLGSVFPALWVKGGTVPTLQETSACHEAGHVLPLQPHRVQCPLCRFAQVLATAAQELSQPDPPKAERPLSLRQPSIQVLSGDNPDPSNWRQVVEERIKTKTRWFAKVRLGNQEPIPVSVGRPMGARNCCLTFQGSGLEL